MDDVWELRPPTPEHLCPDCCVLAMAASHPPFPLTPAPPLPRRATGPDRPVAAESPAERTAAMPVTGKDADP
ncbi:hypothetical protein [Saccharothrix xinjiangensis]|uniref:Uncharacterized protein n=1 Tax=Saccharothrix xinjiangensis TaxID=204798 RepID=A0ABV9XZG2_9PSEU